MSVNLWVEVAAGRPVVAKAGLGPHAEQVRAEADRLRAAAHPGVVTLLDDGPVTGGWQLRTAHGGRPLDNVGRLPVEQAAAVLASVAETVADLHDAGIVCGRLVPEHVLLGTTGRPLLCGFGAGPGTAGPADDVAALGRLLAGLVDGGDRADPVPRWPWSRRRRRHGAARRALLHLAEVATAEMATQRPTARRLARAVVDAVPAARLTPLAPVAPPPGAGPERDGAGNGGGTSRAGHRPRPAHGARRRRHGPAVPAAAAAALAGVALLAVGTARAVNHTTQATAGPGDPPSTIALAVPEDDPAPTEPPADGPGTDPAPTAPGPGAGTTAPGGTTPATAPSPTSSAPGPRSRPVVPAGCPGPQPGVDDWRGPDLDGDGCPDPIALDGIIARVGDRRFAVAEPGDVVVLGDWDCTGVATPAALRPATGEVFAFPAWPGDGDELVVAPTDHLPGATGLAVTAVGTGCDGLVAEVPGRGRVPVATR